MKLNYVGIIGGIIAFISLALPWWTMTLSRAGTTGGDASVYLYQAKYTFMGMSFDLTNPPSPSTPLNIWYSWTALALVIIGGLLGIVGSVTRYGKRLLVGGGAIALLSIIIFAVGLQMELSNPFMGTGPTVGLFSSGNFGGTDYSTYLSFGFWLALVSAIIMFVAIKMQPVEKASPPQS